MEGLVLTPREALSVTVLMDSQDPAVKPTSTSVSRTPARIRAPAWICPGCTDVSVCQVSVYTYKQVKTIYGRCRVF